MNRKSKLVEKIKLKKLFLKTKHRDISLTGVKLENINDWYIPRYYRIHQRSISFSINAVYIRREFCYQIRRCPSSRFRLPQSNK